MSRERSKGFSGDNEFNTRIESEENNETNLLKPMTEKEKEENLDEFQRLADQLATLSLSDNQSSMMKRHIEEMKKIFKETLNKSSIDDKQRKKKEHKVINPAGVYGGRKKSKRNKRRRKRKKTKKRRRRRTKKRKRKRRRRTKKKR